MRYSLMLGLVCIVLVSVNVTAVDVHFDGAYTKEISVNLFENITIDIIWVNQVQYGNATLQYGIFPARGNDLYDDENECQNKSWQSFITVWDDEKTYINNVELINDTLTEPFKAVDEDYDNDDNDRYFVKIHIVLPAKNGNYTIRYLIVANPIKGEEDNTGGMGGGATASDAEPTIHKISISGFERPPPKPKEEEDYTLYIISLIVTSLIALTVSGIMIKKKKKGKK